MHIGKRLRELRSLKGMTQAKVSDGITSASHYSNIEGGQFSTSEEILTLLAQRLSVPVAYLTKGHSKDPEMIGLLEQYEGYLNEDKLDDAKNFRKKHEKSFKYIPSLIQELYFNLLRCIDLYKSDDFKTFKQHYTTKISPYIDYKDLHNFNTSIQEKHNYITGLFHYINGNFKESILFFSNVLKMNTDTLLHARLTFNIALANFRLHNISDALEYIEKSKDLYLNMHNWKKTAECYNLMGVLYKLKNDFDNAEMYVKKGLHIQDNESDQTHMILLHNLALIQREKEDLHVALETIDKCIFLKEKYFPNELFISYLAKLNILLLLKDEDLLSKNIELAQQVCRTKLHEIHLQVIEGKLHLLQHRYSDYEKCLQKCIDYYFKQEQWRDLKHLPEELADYYAEKKQYKKAYELNKICLLANKNIQKEV